MGGCLSTTSAHSAHQGVPSPLTDSNNQTKFQSTKGTAASPFNSGLAETSAALRTHMSSQAAVKRQYFSTDIQTDKQHKLVFDGAKAISDMYGRVQRICGYTAYEGNFDDFLHNATVKFKKNSKACIEYAKAMDKTQKPLQDSCNTLALADSIYHNHELLTKIKDQPKVAHFFLGDNFYPDRIFTFYEHCLSIAAGTVGPKTNSLEQLKFKLISIGKAYAGRGVVENQLKTIKAQLTEVKTQKAVDGDVIAVLEKTLRVVEVSLRNMKQKERKKILEEISPPARPQTYAGSVDLLCYNPGVEDQPEARIHQIIADLKKIPLELA